MWRLFGMYMAACWETAVTVRERQQSMMGLIGAIIALPVVMLLGGKLELTPVGIAWAAMWVTLSAFLNVFFVAPFLMWKRNKQEMESKNNASSSNDVYSVPSGHMSAMARYEGTLAGHEFKLNAISLLVRQYDVITSASKLVNASRGQAARNDKEIANAAELIMGLAKKYTLALPPQPHENLRVQIGWNHYIQIFGSSMVMAPRVRIFDIPDGTVAEVSNITELSFEVRFWPREVEIKTFGVEASCEG